MIKYNNIGTIHYNFIAQEFQQIWPDSAHHNFFGDGLLTIDIHNALIYMITAIKELHKKIQLLKIKQNYKIKLLTKLLTTKLLSV
jgi:tRNA A37 threonylcarbamoyladenosine dehydratase